MNPSIFIIIKSRFQRCGRVLLSALFVMSFWKFTISPAEVFGQQYNSPEVQSDGSVIFRLRASADEVRVNVSGQNLAMKLVQPQGSLWEVQSTPLPAGIHDYSFNVDGVRMIDPQNRWVKKWLTLASMVEVPGNPPLLTEKRLVPHGTLSFHRYDSCAAGKDRPVVVYTPPAYDSNQSYPVVYLLHGFGDDETAWTDVGRAHWITDNLIAEGKIRPAIIVMPYGHPVPVPTGQRPNSYWKDNNEMYEKDITESLMPFIAHHYNVSENPDDRAIVGLSMGGGHALDTGLKNSEIFHHIGAFSAATPEGKSDELATAYPALRGPKPLVNDRLKTLWIPIGSKDFLLERNHQFRDALLEQGVDFKYTETDGGHEWPVWRLYLPEFLQMVLNKE